MRALVVGSTGLLGRHICAALARPGWSLLLHHHRRTAEASELCDTLGHRADDVSTIAADLRDPGAAASLLRGIETLDLLVYAAGSYHRAPLGQDQAGILDELWALNARAPLLTLSAAVDSLTAARGQAIVLTDIAAAQPWRHHVAYGATKAALEHAVRCAALELAPHVRVNAVAPGLVRGAAAVTAERAAELTARIPAGRPVDPEEVARAVVLLADGPAAITGQIIAVDGGRHLGARR